MMKQKGLPLDAAFGHPAKTVEKPYFDRKELVRVCKAAWRQFVQGSRVECGKHQLQVHPDLPCVMCEAETVMKREAEKRKQLRMELGNVVRETLIEVLTEHGFIKKKEEEAATAEAAVEGGSVVKPAWPLTTKKA